MPRNLKNTQSKKDMDSQFNMDQSSADRDMQTTQLDKDCMPGSMNKNMNRKQMDQMLSQGKNNELNLNMDKAEQKRGANKAKWNEDM